MANHNFLPLAVPNGADTARSLSDVQAGASFTRRLDQREGALMATVGLLTAAQANQVRGPS